MLRVKDLLYLDKNFKDIQIIAGSKGINRVIKDVEILEVPDGIYWAQEGDFIITTGYVFQNDQKGLYHAIEVLNSKKCSGIGIKTGRFLKKLSPEILELANRIGVPLLEIPIQLGYSDLTRPIMSKLLGERSYSSYVFEQFTNNLSSIANQNFDLNNILHLLKTYINMPIFMLSNRYKILNTVQHPTKALERLPVSRMINVIQEHSDQIKFINVPFTYKDENAYYHIFAIKEPEQLLGYLCIIDTSYDQDFLPQYLQLIKETILYLTIWMISNHKDKIQNKSKEDFFLDLLHGNYLNNSELHRDATFYKLDINTKNLVWVISLQESKQEKNSKGKNTGTIMDKARLKAEKYCPDTTFIADDSKLICIHLAQDSGSLLTRDYFARILNTLNDTSSQHTFIAGVSREHDTLQDLKAAYEEALLSCYIGPRVSSMVRGVYFYKDLTVYHLLYEYANHPMMMKIYENTVEKLTSFDQLNGSELLKTLATFIDSDGKIGNAAKKLFIHRNTLYNRLQKITEITGYNPYDSEGRLLLLLNLKFHDIKNIVK
ncbi:hypothetical protein BR63_01100 [Thermanaerosceptrum fracticalcis]|uniref:PucR family transcriptional regulator n=1 Tax=Thermanaerosceptrum fracticalcis TaxID=1712410 RepID=A0A7G6DYY6_THEFR|nr:PucR family transcriptional regulator [Thermanaerosceptrum fracticalcis]QNB45040.1 hypothetical protein BR63_01100 [Thermanaerosceptrum fracticalcis]